MVHILDRILDVTWCNMSPSAGANVPSEGLEESRAEQSRSVEDAGKPGS